VTSTLDVAITDITVQSAVETLVDTERERERERESCVLGDDVSCDAVKSLRHLVARRRCTFSHVDRWRLHRRAAPPTHRQHRYRFRFRSKSHVMRDVAVVGR